VRQSCRGAPGSQMRTWVKQAGRSPSAEEANCLAKFRGNNPKKPRRESQSPIHRSPVGVPQVRASARTWVYDSRAKPLLLFADTATVSQRSPYFPL
jgi:hypothetical protein